MEGGAATSDPCNRRSCFFASKIVTTDGTAVNLPRSTYQGDGAEVIAEADGVELISRRRIGGDVSGSMPASPASPGKMARRRSSVDGGEDDEDAFEDPGWEVTPPPL